MRQFNFTAQEVRFLAESDRIENIHLPLGLYKAVNEGLECSREGAASRYVRDHMLAFHYVKQTSTLKQPLLKRHLLHVHDLLLRHKDPEIAGVIRTKYVYVCGHRCPAAEHLELLLTNFLQLFNGCKLRTKTLHYEFEHIHPFWDGNGRTGRLLWAWDMLRNGYAVRPFLRYYRGDFETKKQAYFDALGEYRTTTRKKLMS